MLNVQWDELKAKISDTELEKPISNALIAFLGAFSDLPPEPNTINPHYMGMLLWMLVNDVCTKEEVKELWWEMILDLARKWAADRNDAGQEAIQTIESLSPHLERYFDNDDSHITLEEITQETVRGILLLSETLSEYKRYYVAPNAVSLSQANFSETAWFRAIYAGRMPVGFVMLHIDEEKAEYFVWRLMIGEPFHGRGYGRKAIQAIMEHVRTLPNVEYLELSYGQGPGSPEGFYKKLGFKPTGKVEYGEVYARIKL